MTVPTCFASSFRYYEHAGITDVDTIISDFRSEVVTNGSPAWTEPSTGLFQCPVDANSRWFDVLLTKIDATHLEIRVRDWAGTSIYTARRIMIDAGGTTVRYFTGEKHFVVESERATREVAWATFLDLSPESQTAHDRVVIGNAYRDNANNQDGQGNYWSYIFRKTNAAWQGGICLLLATTGQIHYKTYGGRYLWTPVYDNYSNDYTIAGRRYQMMLTDTDYAFGSEVTVPLDGSTNGVFRVVGMGNYNNTTIAVRKS